MVQLEPPARRTPTVHVQLPGRVDVTKRIVGAPQVVHWTGPHRQRNHAQVRKVPDGGVPTRSMRRDQLTVRRGELSPTFLTKSVAVVFATVSGARR